MIDTAIVVIAGVNIDPNMIEVRVRVAKVDIEGIGNIPPQNPTATDHPIEYPFNVLAGMISFSSIHFRIATMKRSLRKRKSAVRRKMERLKRIIQYFRTPLVFCATAQTLAIPQGPKKSEQMLDHLQKLLGSSWGNISTWRYVLDWDSVRKGADVLRPETLRNSRDRGGYVIDDCREPLFHDLSFPRLGECGWKHTENAAGLLDVGKKVVPHILNFQDGDVSISVETEFGFSRAGYAEGDGFTCSVFRKEAAGAIPMYVICGDLRISAAEFHALACDVDFRSQWDEQFHSASVSEIKNNVSLVKWVVKWPWPLARREYTYLLSPHTFSDGTKVVLSTGVLHNEEALDPQAVAVREYFGITAAKSVAGNCRYCVFYFDDPKLPGKMPSRLEQYVTSQLLPSFPLKLLEGAKKYPPERLKRFGDLNATNS